MNKGNLLGGSSGLAGRPVEGRVRHVSRPASLGYYAEQNNEEAEKTTAEKIIPGPTAEKPEDGDYFTS
jgi:hypothetical protein